MEKRAACIIQLSVFFLLFVFVNFLSVESADSDTPKKLPECPYIDPIKEMERWNKFDHTSCNITLFVPTKEENPEDYERYMSGEHNYAFNLYASDKIGPRRHLDEAHHATHNKCLAIDHSNVKLKASIIIIYYNEAFSVLARMINGIVKETPSKHLHEIILYDDFSEPENMTVEENLKKYGEIAGWDFGGRFSSGIFKFHRATKREGLIRAKVLAAREATGDVLIFLDSHCEVTCTWIEPLLAPLEENPKRIVLPVVDLIDPVKFEYSKAMVAKGTFDWSLIFQWTYFDWSYFEDETNYVKPFKTVATSGGLLAIRRDFFKELGELDEGMEIWGGENIELSIRVWLCGGEILTAPCSRVGHVFRYRRPYVGKPGVDTNLYNSLRTANVWLDEYKRYFLEARPNARGMDFGDVSDRVALRKSLNCKPFSHFVDTVNPELKKKTLEKTEL